MALQVPSFKPEDLVMSASGKKVRKGEVVQDRAPEIRFEEIEWGEKIGGGCFGSVYKGKCRGINVAIKKLLKQDLDPKVMEDFRKEVDIMTQMRHPNIVLFLGACTEPGKMCIVCELLLDSIHGLLHKQGAREISFLNRMKMAKDTAAGVAWLHGANPQIIHRDIKPQNLLVDEHGNVKVCDFGLSQVKLQEQKIRDGKSIPGTPLWMAPEVLLGKDVDEKSDVYSFGIVLWEIITGSEPFGHMDSYGTFKRAITKENERPEIPRNIQELYPSLTELMQRCWHADSAQRPSFTQIMPIIDSVLVDCLIDDPIGNRFWKENFLGRERVAWLDFQQAFTALLKYPIPINPKDLNWACFKKILAEPNSDLNSRDPDMVRLEKFAHLLHWFGPLTVEETRGAGGGHSGLSSLLDKFKQPNTILDKIRTLMQKDWFHGDISKEVAEDLLAGQPKGSYLVRTSVTEKISPFTISKVNKKGKINHQRVHKRPDGTFELTIKYPDGKSKTIDSKDDQVASFIRSVASELSLEIACPGSRYKALFLQTKVEGYLSTDNDDD